MRKLLLSIAILLHGVTGFAQKFLVIEDDKRINQRISNRITTLGYTVVKEVDKADYIAQMIYEKRKGYMSFRTGWKNEEYKYNKVGYIAFLSAKGDTLSTTEEQGGIARYYNTYVALSELTNKILKKDFNNKLKEAIKDFTTHAKNPTTQTISKADELIKLKKLMDDGVLTKDEFEAEKKKILEN
ncbi:MAG: SHOCT domain-containing protein [Chitinophagaceae bacterium]|nr:MAG: SHOCT domain-containing protein [Chitinophagaceae bacterium]